MDIPGEDAMRGVIQTYRTSFSEKVYGEENDDHDVLMDVFGISPELKRQNRQYWGRELGMCWQLLVTALFRETVKDFAKPSKEGADELTDLYAGKDAIDTKYRIGSGDSGTLKKFKTYGKALTASNYTPIMLILRTDNLPAAITACYTGGWTVYSGNETFRYIRTKTGVDLEKWLGSLGNHYHIQRE